MCHPDGMDHNKTNLPSLIRAPKLCQNCGVCVVSLLLLLNVYINIGRTICCYLSSCLLVLVSTAVCAVHEVHDYNIDAEHKGGDITASRKSVYWLLRPPLFFQELHFKRRA